MAIEISRDHSLGETRIRERVEQIAQEMATSIHLNYHWEGNKVKFDRTGLTGILEYTKENVRITIHPSLWLPVPDSWIREQVNSYLDQYLDGVSQN